MAYTLIYSDADKDIYSVDVTIVRSEVIKSGSMQFTHPRYITFGQTVVFTDMEIGSPNGALVFKRGEESVLDNIIDYIPYEKDLPDNTLLWEEPD